MIEDPLAGLADVDWASLSHAYGPAEDVPAQLRALSTEDGHEHALYQLYGNIFHQGSRYPAAAAAVPFVAALVREPGTPRRDELVCYLDALAIGYDESYLPGGVPIQAWRTHVAQEPDAELAAYDAVRAEVPGLLPLLDDPDAEVRTHTAHLLGWFPELRDTTAPRLTARLAVETVRGVRATLVVALGLLGGPDAVATATAVLADEDRLMRWAAATALANLGPVDTAVLTELAGCSADPPEQTAPVVPYLDADVAGYAALSLAARHAEVTEDMVDAMLTGLGGDNLMTLLSTTASVLYLAFGPHPATGTPDTLTDRQRRTLHALTTVPDESWQLVNFTEQLRHWGLPADLDGLRRLLGER